MDHPLVLRLLLVVVDGRLLRRHSLRSYPGVRHRRDFPGQRAPPRDGERREDDRGEDGSDDRARPAAEGNAEELEATDGAETGDRAAERRQRRAHGVRSLALDLAMKDGNIERLARRGWVFPADVI